MCLIATDIAARGLDFPAVDWVVQVDCPEDIATYIHRVGRTARYTSGGKALCMLTPREKRQMDDALRAGAAGTVKTIKMNPDKRQVVAPALAAILSKVGELKAMAQEALVAYLRCIYLQPNKAIFDVESIDAGALAMSMGLVTQIPTIKFLDPKKKKDKKEEEEKKKEKKEEDRERSSFVNFEFGGLKTNTKRISSSSSS